MDVSETLINLEMELVRPSTRANVERMNELIAEDFEEFGSSGDVITKKDVLRGGGPLPRYELSTFSVHELGERAALVKYRASIPGQMSYRSSVWVRRGNRWQMFHHQSTLVPGDV